MEVSNLVTVKYQVHTFLECKLINSQGKYMEGANVMYNYCF
jgi:hypothetical protein